MHHAAITPHLRVGMQFCLCPESFRPYRIELLRVESQPTVLFLLLSLVLLIVVVVLKDIPINIPACSHNRLSRIDMK